MRTASFFTYTGPGRISIARWAPRGTPRGYRCYAALAPRREMRHMPREQYRDIYFREILGRLDACRVVDDLHRLAGGVEPVLLCWERPPFDEANFCHRRMVAEWIEAELGLIVPEMARGPASAGVAGGL